MRDLSLEELAQHLKNFLKKEENKNYIYFSAFFLIFSFFLIFVIRPTLKSAFESKVKREELTKATSRVEAVINKAVYLQSEAEKYRDDFPLLYEAIPEQVYISQVMRQITNIIRNNKLILVNSNISDIKLVGKTNKGLKTVTLKYILGGNFSNFLKFMRDLNNQRRLKIIKRVTLLRKNNFEINASDEADLTIKLEITTYFF